MTEIGSKELMRQQEGIIKSSKLGASMTPEEEQQIIEHSRAIAKILYKNTASEQLTSLAKIEQVVRAQMQEYVMPEVGVFLSKMPQEKAEDTNEK